MPRRLLLLSNSRDPAGNYLKHPRRQIRAFLGARVETVLLVPFASVTASYDESAALARAAFAEMGLIPFQINAHYTDFHPPGFRGETRAERIAEFLEVNPGVTVVGLPEGTMLRVEGDDVFLEGSAAAPVFRKGRPTAF